MIRTPVDIAQDIHCMLGDLEEISDVGEQPFHPLRIEFLATLSKALRLDARTKAFPDVITFAFWCRRANIESLAKKQNTTQLRVGLGMVFHISPSNVPINFAYSLVFSFLSGNTSVVRLPSRHAPQTDLLVETLNKLLAAERYVPLRPTIHLIRYGHADHITNFWLQHALGRIVWGGDATVAHIRTLKSHPRSREIAFVDRYSLAAIAAGSLVNADVTSLQTVCKGLYNDIYLMDQHACSSPQLLIWVGNAEEVAAAQTRLWPQFTDYVRDKYALEPVHAMDKYVALCCNSIDHDNIAQVSIDSPLLTRITLRALTPQQTEQRGFFGTVHEYATTSLEAIAPIVNARFQTMTTFGFAREALREFVIGNLPSGIDRIVTIGRALEMDFVWDGFDMMSSLTRIVDIQ